MYCAFGAASSLEQGADPNANGINEQADCLEWQARATLCELLATSLRYPDDMLAQAVASGEWAAAAAEVAAAFGFSYDIETEATSNDTDPMATRGNPLAADCDGAPVGDAATMLHVLRREATRLFGTPPRTPISPYEGIWRAADDGVEGYLYVNPHSIDVERFCRACGLGRPGGTNEPLDHIATEFELLEYLSAVEAGIVAPVADACDLGPESPLREGAANAYERFAREHVLVWAGGLADALAAKTRLPFYRAVARLLSATVASRR